MKIVGVDVFELTIPFTDGGSGIGLTAGTWNKFDTVFIRLTTDNGLVGWGEAFSYECRNAVLAVARDMVAPLVLGKEIGVSDHIMIDVQRKLDRFGRYGISMFAISGFDIAIWDLLAKNKGISLAQYLGGAKRLNVPAYASLVRYTEPDLVAFYAAEAVAKGYRSVKLHEIDLAAISAGRRGAGADTHLTVDVNCAFDPVQVRKLLPALAELHVDWLEEPVFPPEDVAVLSELSSTSPVPIAAGENWCTRYQFSEMIRNRAVTYPQPSITKVGGVTEYIAILKEAELHGVTCMPHTPYFGPGYFATLQLLALNDDKAMLEYLYVTSEAYPGLNTPEPVNGKVSIPDDVGIGFVPDKQVFNKYGRKVFSLSV